MAVMLSVLDLGSISDGQSPQQALRNGVELAQLTERWGFARYWVAEHHHTSGVASSAPAVLVGHIAEKTRTIRVGAGGVLLPYHAPLVVAEQFATLAALYPDRIDLGLGRGPRLDSSMFRALRRDHTALETFPQDVSEVVGLLNMRGGPDTVLRAGSALPVWVLASSLGGAQLAAALGLPFAFAAQFAPDALMPALQTYRANFRASAEGKRSYAMVGVNVIVAGTDEHAQCLFTSHQQYAANQIRGIGGGVPPPIENIETHWSPTEKKFVRDTLQRSFVGSPETVRAGLQQFLEQTKADELIVLSVLHDHGARLESYSDTVWMHAAAAPHFEHIRSRATSRALVRSPHNLNATTRRMRAT